MWSNLIDEKAKTNNDPTFGNSYFTHRKSNMLLMVHPYPRHDACTPTRHICIAKKYRTFLGKFAGWSGLLDGSFTCPFRLQLALHFEVKNPLDKFVSIQPDPLLFFLALADWANDISRPAQVNPWQNREVEHPSYSGDMPPSYLVMATKLYVT